MNGLQLCRYMTIVRLHIGYGKTTSRLQIIEKLTFKRLHTDYKKGIIFKIAVDIHLHSHIIRNIVAKAKTKLRNLFRR